MTSSTPTYWVTESPATSGPFWPKTSTHTWNAFPYLAIEAGGYRDLSLTDPYTGRTLTAMVDLTDPDDPDFDPYAAIRRLIDIAQDRQWLETPAERAQAFADRFTNPQDGADFAYNLTKDHPAYRPIAEEAISIDDHTGPDGVYWDGLARDLTTWWNDEAARLRAVEEGPDA